MYFKKNLIVVISMLLLMFCANASENMIRDGGFELEYNNIKDINNSWTIWGPQEGKIWGNFTRDTTNPHSGNACMKVFGKGDRPSIWHGVLASNPQENILTPKKGKKYTLTFWARTDTPGSFVLHVGAYKDIKPMVQGSSILKTSFAPDENWKKFSYSFNEGKDMFAENARYMYVGFFIKPRNDNNISTDKTLWVDDVSLVEEDSTPGTTSLINPATADVPPLPLCLKKGDNVNINIDASKITGDTCQKAGGISVSNLGRWAGTPYSKTGEYNFNPVLEKGVRELKLPFTRYYAMIEKEVFSTIENSIDAAASFQDKTGIPKETTIICLEPWHARTDFSPETWAKAVRHSLKKGYRFRYWEVGNEVYFPETMYKNPQQYIKHVKEVSKAIREVQPDAQIGMSINSSDIQWANLVMKEAAGYYDFVCPHLYGGFGKNDPSKFEQTVIENNHRKLDEAREINYLLKAYNPDRKTYIYDTEWGMHSSADDGGRADCQPRNGNIFGTIYRAIRLLYYARENLVYGASAWNLHGKEPGFSMLNVAKPNSTTMLYWLYYYFNRNVGEKAIGMTGTTPYYENKDTSLPLVPAMATISKDGNTLYLMLVNGSWKNSYPASINIKGFASQKHNAVLLTHDDINADPEIKEKSEFVKDLAISRDGDKLAFEIPAHSIAFITLNK